MRTGIFVCIAMAAAIGTASRAAAAPETEPRRRSETAEAPKGEKFFKEGREAMLTGKYEQAISLLTKAVEADPSKTTYRLYLARACRHARKDKQAEEQLKAILKTTPDHIEAGQLLGEIYTDQEKWQELVELLEPLLKYRHDYKTYQLLAEGAYNLGKHDKARKYYEEAIKLNDKSPADHYQLGNIYLAGNFFALAAESYQKALALGLDSPVLRYKLASAYFNLRNYFGRISVVTVKAGKVATISGDWYLIEKVPGKEDTFRAAPGNSAVYQLAKAIADGIEDRPDIHFMKANIYLNARRYKQAYEMFGGLKETIPAEDKALFYYYYSQAAFGVGKYDEYLDFLREAIELDPDAYKPTLVEAYQRVAEQHNQAGQLDKYIHFLELAVAESPMSASLHLRLGDAYREDRQYAKAVVQWRMVLALEPDHPNRMDLINLINKHRQETTPERELKT